MSEKRLYTIVEIAEIAGVGEELVLKCVREQWVSPAKSTTGHLDEEDLARIRLIHELRSDFGVNDESIPVILHLLDQLYYLKAQLKRFQF